MQRRPEVCQSFCGWARLLLKSFSEAHTAALWVDSLKRSTALHKNVITVAGWKERLSQARFFVWESQGVEQHPAEAGTSAARSPLHNPAVPTHLLSLHFPAALVGTHI